MLCQGLFREVDESVNFVQHAIQGVFAALVATGVPIQELAIELGYYCGNGDYVSPDMLALPGISAAEAKSKLLHVSALSLAVNT